MVSNSPELNTIFDLSLKRFTFYIGTEDSIRSLKSARMSGLNVTPNILVFS